jgi:hypothetical protein
MGMLSTRFRGRSREACSFLKEERSAIVCLLRRARPGVPESACARSDSPGSCHPSISLGAASQAPRRGAGRDAAERPDGAALSDAERPGVVPSLEAARKRDAAPVRRHAAPDGRLGGHPNRQYAARPHNQDAMPPRRQDAAPCRFPGVPCCPGKPGAHQDVAPS